ncbi:DNA mismatch repair endonuclease MutL [Vibrio aestuarianus]|uniref:DNA mismatch repair protein MutL n=1 Tax=Vibrio aestuarianus TaxID=28171 RepID=A0A9X4J1A9_9VIBR|nr:DNA mismatch repair endonuclease MutL [Vibrio aestuarianus]MDE1309502.1 DNA mismatch repair endonuclease MutL [Vibrio aestuarianus]MDE1358443.1 DNA mismatch repair endonuclease MutL [Vibrio aestuarianus]NGZ18601.1 DNA mismatch repair endonuclease MutL [Vibrio aestuarianus]NGZ93619.1 DNA mismatch repair endonuclease MutL [Vibrio aestuarianus subsp. cardii]
MVIKILPARLANQIAAGEVVERPASVVKELVENSLDSGATRIDIDIEKGGAKLIRVRDNGTGIDKEELALALSRHATSKIHTLDDLEAIVSLGFRGEALASISSVSRLTLTSRPATQEQAWAAHSEGRDMAVKLEPTAHPIGTSVEVLDLFFNTPARRKFLRTEKTEFTHIDELLKRIALSRFDVTINVRHNGKMVRQYRAAKTTSQEEKRIAAVCGNAFVRHMLRIELEHQGLKLHGWITTPEGARQQSDLQYCYVNGRMMRDKLINHAIRQSYETSLKADQFATYVLFIELDPHQVDVNVHPAKHEVRFHQARLVHDFIYQALSSALAESKHITEPEVNQSAFHHSSVELANKGAENREIEKSDTDLAAQIGRAVNKVPAYPRKADSNYAEVAATAIHSIQEAPKRSEWQQTATQSTSRSNYERSPQPSPSKVEVKAYQELMKTVQPVPAAPIPAKLPETLNQPLKLEQLGKAISVIQGQYLLMGSKQGVVLLSLIKGAWLKTRGQLNTAAGELKSQPLLVPLSLKLSEPERKTLAQCQPVLRELGIELKERNAQNMMVMGVPQPLRQQNLQHLIPDLLSYASLNLNESGGQIKADILADWLAQQTTEVKSDYTLSEAIQMISELEQLWQGKLPLHDTRFVQPVDFSTTIAALLA